MGTMRGHLCDSRAFLFFVTGILLHPIGNIAIRRVCWLFVVCLAFVRTRMQWQVVRGRECGIWAAVRAPDGGDALLALFLFFLFPFIYLLYITMANGDFSLSVHNISQPTYREPTSCL